MNGMNLSSDVIKSVLEATCKVSDEKAAKIDTILSNNDLEDVFDDACPITSEVGETLKEMAADPSQLRMTYMNGEIYCEAGEFANFCEANGCGLEEGVEIVAEAYESEIPGIRKEKFHLVFPQNSVADVQKGPVSGIGYGVKDNWAVKLMNGCLQFGLKANVGVEPSDVYEEDDDTAEVEID